MEESVVRYEKGHCVCYERACDLLWGGRGLLWRGHGRIPKVGEEVRIANCRILIHEAEPRSIRSVQIFREEKSPAHVEAPNLDLVS